jgi:N-acetyl-anhydromuramyl-L-alanine amidase AmpD
MTTARFFTKGRKGKKIQVLVLHTAENQELPGQAKHLEQWFAGSSSPQASAHEMIDNKQIVVSVDDADTAWSVDDFPLNLVSKNYEMTGHASNTAKDWADAYEADVIKLTVKEFKKDMKKYGIPPVHLTDYQILAIHNGNNTIKGVCTHADISRALKVAGGHQDPGPNFPMAAFIKALV